MKICDYNKCTGCSACFNVCHKKAILMKEDEYGFLRPKVGADCVNCGICVNVCPIKTPIDKHKPSKCFAAESLDRRYSKYASSGGIATILSRYYIENGDIVYGAMFNENNELIHECIDSLVKLNKAMGSKYAQSHINGAYKDCKDRIEQGRNVLFIGTPCQIAGLYNYLKKIDTKRLTTLDLVCHGVPSQKYLREHIKTITDKKVKTIKFRGPESTKYVFNLYTNNEAVVERDMAKDEYGSYFGRGITFRESCYQCQFACSQRIGDITLGDFHGIGRAIKYHGSMKVSMMTINTEKGNELFDKVKDRIEYQSRPYWEAVKGNPQLKKPMALTQEHIDFINIYKELNNYDKTIQELKKRGKNV